MNLNELTELLLTDNAGVTRLVDRLETKGLARRRTSASDRRAVVLALTGSGRALIPRLVRLAALGNRRFLSGFSGGDQRRLRSFLQRLLRNAAELSA